MNLTETSKWFKIFSIVLIIVIFLYYFIVYLFLPATSNFISSIIPERDPPTVSFGILPPLQFTNKEITGNPTYELNTNTGQLPRGLPNKLNVYRIIQNPYTFDSGRIAQNDALTFGFTDEDLISDLRGEEYRWRDINTGIQLEVDLSSKNLKISSNLEGRGDQYFVGIFDENRAIEYAESTLQKIQRIDNSYLVNTRAIAGRYQNDRLIQIEDFDRAHLYKLDFFRRINGTNVMSPDANKGNISLIIGRDANNPKIQDLSTLNVPYAEIYYNEIVTNSNATYPLIPVYLAWNEVTSGNGVVSSVVPRGYNPFVEYTTEDVRDIIINDIYLAYYENPINQEFLQPIYVFSGNYRSTGSQGGDITIYYPAIEGSYIRSVE